jgi:hypothetical protein
MKFNLNDLFIGGGVLLVLAGAWLIDPGLAVMVAGGGFVGAGVVRSRGGI